MNRSCAWRLLLCLAFFAQACANPRATPAPMSTPVSDRSSETSSTAEPSTRLLADRSADIGGVDLPELTKEALGELDRAGAFLASQTRFSFRADIAYDVMQANGQLLEFGGTRDITVRRPDRMLFRATDRAGVTTRLYFDGQTISVDLPRHGAYVEIERPGTLYAALDHLIEDLGIPAPLEDLISEDFSANVGPRIASGYLADTALFSGRRCLRIAFRMSDVDVQFWIEEGDRPLPCRISITYKHEPGSPQFRAQLDDWNLTPDVPDSLFEFQPSADAEKISVAATGRARANTEEAK